MMFKFLNQYFTQQILTLATKIDGAHMGPICHFYVGTMWFVRKRPNTVTTWPAQVETILAQCVVTNVITGQARLGLSS